MDENKIIGAFEAPAKEELCDINKYTRRSFSADEVYAFSVVLCDNEVDRDFERFTDGALENLAKLFKGVTGIFDHSHKAENQCARIFNCFVETVEGRKNSLGEPYKRLFARAYMPKSAKASELILEIESGIKKEVSVGCSMAASTCSICGKSAGLCEHVKGRQYRVGNTKKLCYFELSEPKDAYEWSFVAVPAQPMAGVVKNFCEQEEYKLGGFMKKLEKGRVVLSSKEAEELSLQIESLRELAESAGEYLKSQKAAIIKQMLPNATQQVSELVASALDRLPPSELYKLKAEIDRVDEKAVPQLATAKSVSSKTDSKNSIFKI